MSNKNSNVPYDQIPHIVINHPETNSEHKEIMRALFKVLKDTLIPIIYTNESISQATRIPLRTVERRISELKNMMFLSITGRGFQRRISLGLLFNNSATLAVINPTTAKSVSTTAKNDTHNRQCGGDYNHYTKPYTKENLSLYSLNHFENKEIEYCIKNNFPLSSDFKYLQSLFDEILQNEKTKTIYRNNGNT